MLKTITVGELMQLLSDYDPATPAIFASNYGDRGRTQQAHGLRGHAEEVQLCESGYSDSGYAVADEEDDDNEQDTYLLIK